MPVWLSYPSRQRDDDDDGAAAAVSSSSSSPSPSSPRTKHCLVFFVPGNPGYIDYYEPFLATLRMLLDEVEDTSRRRHRDEKGARDVVRFHILGRNLLGFEDGDGGGGSYGPGPYDVDTQIRASMDAVAAARIDLGKGNERRPQHGAPFDEVVLMGHSVGSYIALEIFRRQQKEGEGNAASVVPGGTVVHAHPHPRLRLGILLFATLTHLAQSPRGRVLEGVLTMPLLGRWADVAAQAALWWLLPVWAMAWIVQSVLRFPPHAAAVTVRFLASRGGVRQALYLGRDELKCIGADRWEDELWEVAGEGDADDVDDEDDKGDGAPKFIILFGENDHWVANEVRDEFIARRAAHKRGRARIVVDERGWPHDFCIRHGEEVAETVKTWIADLAEAL